MLGDPPGLFASLLAAISGGSTARQDGTRGPGYQPISLSDEMKDYYCRGGGNNVAGDLCPCGSSSELMFYDGCTEVPPEAMYH